jgi:hypothetical protein
VAELPIAILAWTKPALQKRGNHRRSNGLPNEAMLTVVLILIEMKRRHFYF